MKRESPTTDDWMENDKNQGSYVFKMCTYPIKKTGWFVH